MNNDSECSCPTGCSSCQDKMACTACMTGKFLIDGVCKCHPQCQDCNGPLANNCLSCSLSNTYLDTDGSCVSICGDIFYGNNVTKKC